MKTSNSHRHSRVRPGPYTRAADPIRDARHALESGVPADRVVTMLLPVAMRQRRVGALYRLLDAYGAADALLARLDGVAA